MSRAARWASPSILGALLVVASLLWPGAVRGGPAELHGRQAESGESEPGSRERAEVGAGQEGADLDDDQILTEKQQEALELVRRILRQEERMLTGRDYSYDPGGRRDPFRSLLQTGPQQVEAPSQRPRGLAGVMVQEVQVQGIARYLDSWNAVLVAPDGTTHFAGVGDRLFDGRIVEITQNQVVFEQEVRDAMGNRRVRRIVKELRSE